MDCKMEKSKIQMLYDACNYVFSQEELPNFQQIQWLKNILNTFKAVDVGIDEFRLDGSPGSGEVMNSNGLISGQGVSEITYIHIYECDQFSMGIFCFPAGRTFPLHDHPGMTFTSKPTIGFVGRLVAPEQMSSSMHHVNHRSLFPRSGGNIHSFTALTPCAILDVLSPPYSDDLGRPSTYFLDFPIPSLPGYAWLEEREVKLPCDLVVKGAPYLGPPLDVPDDDLC
ncbi:hypothetical protein CXB51_011405 [Gossypium anomalum]|uniref:cysteine dioxygenase n=1 Tax=Gossypium anomalum TaxID=47600 RepID=A0A8J5Z4A7_9ROSI|nr:hypothetical protein CXB51_011405 [Gossypium anomalum]